MRRPARALAIALIAVAGLTAGCGRKAEGDVRVTVIGEAPRMADPAAGPLSAPSAVLLGNVAQGLVRFDANGQIEPGLAERWHVTDDGLSYIFRMAAGEWPDGRKLTAHQVARILRRSVAASSANPLKDTLGAVEEIVSMTDRVLEIRLRAPRPNLLQLLAQPEFSIIREGQGTGPFTIAAEPAEDGALRLRRSLPETSREDARRERVLLGHATGEEAVRRFAAGATDLVLGGTFDDLPLARAVRLPRGALRFDPVAGLFGLAPVRTDSPVSEPDVRLLLSRAVDRDALVAAWNVPGLGARTTILEPRLDGLPDPVVPAWVATPLDERRVTLIDETRRLFGSDTLPTLRLLLPEGRGSELLLARLRGDWGALGFTVERARRRAEADLTLVDLVAPSTSPAWFLRRFRCGVAPICDAEASALLDAARTAPIPAQRAALLFQASQRMDELQLFIPLGPPLRWSLVADRVRGFAGNRFGRHDLTGLEETPERKAN